MKEIKLDELLKAGAHFGHQTSRWNPKMSDFIFTVRNNIHIMDLEKTRSKLLDAMAFVKNIASRGGTVLFVATKRQSKNAVRDAAIAAGQPYIITRWLGGTFTNFRTIQKTIKKMERYEQLQATGELQKNYTKKERLLIERELAKMKTLFEGIKDMRKLPEAVVIFDVNHNDIAFTESRKSNVKIIGVVDTNSNPEGIDYPIPSNDDAIKAIHLIAEALASAIIEGKNTIQVSTATVSSTVAPAASAVAAETKESNE
jgi:small subunit ribosomal protein S2